ncbi:hypothetical protein OXX59_007399, partial [Metschnikowia pulcherrima]
FDPSTLKVANLRGILFNNGVSYPSNAKKSELVDLFYEKITKKPKSSKAKKVPLSEEEKEAKRLRKERKAKKQSLKKNLEDPDNEFDGKSEESRPTTAVSSHEKVSKKKKTRKTSEYAEKDLGSHTVEVLDSDVEDAPKSEHTEITKDTNPSPKAVNASHKHEGPAKGPKEELKGSGSSPGGKSTEPEKIELSSTPQKSPQMGHVSSSVSQSRKRKSMLDEINLKITTTPSKGNIFEVETDSEPEVLSSLRKKPRHDPEPLEKGVTGSPKSPTQKHARHKEKRFDTSHRQHENSGHAIAVAADPLPPITPERDLKKPLSPIQKRAFPRTRIEPPVLQPVSAEPPSTDTSTVLSESTGEPSLWFKTQESFNPENAAHLPAETSDAADGFDAALKKLKRENRSEDLLSSAQKKAELAKLLDIDVSSIRPKPRGKRNITPRRPIIVSRGSERIRDGETQKKSGPFERKQQSTLDAEELSSDEEDSADSTMNLSRKNEHAENVPESITPKRSRAPRPSLFSAVVFFGLWLSLVGALLFGYWYREQTFLVGYCGTQINRRTVPDTPETPRFLVTLGDYLDANFKPACVECPQHARCFPRLEIACYDDFVVSAPWYYPYVPNFNLQAQKCVPDTKKAEKIEIMIDVALDLLRARNANENCGRADKDDVSAGLRVQELHDLLLALKAPYITVEEFEELWERSVVELEKEPELIVRYTGDYNAPTTGDNDSAPETHLACKVLRSTSLSHVSLKCMMSNTVVKLMARFKRVLAGIFVLGTLSCAAYWKYKQHKLYARKVETLYHEVLSKLRKQAKLGRASRELPEFIGSVQLRDLILSSEQNLAYKMRLWQAVSQKVERNTNVRHELLEVHGEVMKVWQWISHLE